MALTLAGGCFTAFVLFLLVQEYIRHRARVGAPAHGTQARARDPQ